MAKVGDLGGLAAEAPRAHCEQRRAKEQRGHAIVRHASRSGERELSTGRGSLRGEAPRAGSKVKVVTADVAGTIHQYRAIAQSRLEDD